MGASTAHGRGPIHSDRRPASSPKSARRQGDEQLAVVAAHQCEHVLLLLRGGCLDCARDLLGTGNVLSTQLNYDVSRLQAYFRALTVRVDADDRHSLFANPHDPSRRSDGNAKVA